MKQKGRFNHDIPMRGCQRTIVQFAGSDHVVDGRRRHSDGDRETKDGGCGVAVLSATETKRVSEIEEEKRIATAVAQQTKNTTIPVILSISFPSVIANDKREIPGTVEFYDEGGDASTLRFLVVSGSFDANEFTTKLVAGTKINGKLGFNIWCEGLQTIDLQIWVIDDQNNTSQPRTITYSCVDPSELPPSN